jgi:hypothetical protein
MIVKSGFSFIKKPAFHILESRFLLYSLRAAACAVLPTRCWRLRAQNLGPRLGWETELLNWQPFPVGPLL